MLMVAVVMRAVVMDGGGDADGSGDEGGVDGGDGDDGDDGDGDGWW